MTITGNGKPWPQPPKNGLPKTTESAITPATIRMIRRASVLTSTGAVACPSSGTNSQTAAYTRMPAPPKRVSTASTTRMTVGSTSKCRPRPPATPAT